ncbi:MAG: hypothetical protein ACREYC_25825 [Gammaproteobacteria bacterium]
MAELESIVVRSAQRFEPESTAEDAELAYYLETKARRGGHPAPAKPAAPAPQNRNDPHNKVFLGFSEEDFEAAFRSLETQPPSAPVRARSGFVTVVAVTGFVFVAVIGALIYSWIGE